jgi:hypothetical protein
MSASVLALSEPRSGFRPAPEFERVRDGIVDAYQPANPEEALLVEQIARAWFRLQKYYDLETALLEKQSLEEMFDSDLERFNALQRALTSAERMWRHAVAEFHAARRRASAASPNAPSRGRASRSAPIPVPSKTAGGAAAPGRDSSKPEGPAASTGRSSLAAAFEARASSPAPPLRC